MAFRNINVLLSANDASLRTALTRSGQAVNKFSNEVKKANAESAAAGTSLKAGFGAAALAVVATLGYAVSAAAKFEQRMRNVNSISKLSEGAFRALESRVLALSRTLPQSANTLAEGLYDIASSGYQGGAGLKVLEASAKAASAGLSDTQTAAQAITAVLNAYGLSAQQAGYVSDVLFQTVNLGVVTFGQLAGSIGDVVGIGAAANVSIDQLGSAIATMTLAGVGAAEASTSLNRLIQALIQPSDALANVLHDAGYESGYMALQQLGLHGTMELIRKATGGNVEALLKLFPEIRAARGAFALLANEGKNYAKVAAEIENRQKVSGATQAAFNEQMKSFSNQMKLFANRAQATAIVVGTALLPVLVKATDFLNKLVKQGIDFATSAIATLGPAIDSLSKSFQHIVEFGRRVIEFIKPFAEGLGEIAGAGAVIFIEGFAKALELLTGLLEHNRVAIAAFSAIIMVQLVTALRAAVVGFAIAKWEAFSAMIVATATKVRTAVGAFLLMAQVSGGGLVGGLRAAGSALHGFLTSPAGAATLILGGLFLVQQSIQRVRQEGSRWADEWVRDLHVNSASLSSMQGGLDKVRDKLNALYDSASKRHNVKGFLSTVLDVDLNLFGIDAINSLQDDWGKIQGLTKGEAAALQAQYSNMLRNIVQSFEDSGLAEAFNKDFGTTIRISKDQAKELEKIFGDLNLPKPDASGWITVLANDPNWTKVAANAGLLNDELDSLARAAQAAGIDLSTNFADKLTTLITDTAGLPPGMQQAKLAIAAVGDASDIGADKVDKLKSAIKALLDGSVLSVDEAKDKYVGAMNAMAEAAIDANKHKVNFNANTDDALRFRDATRQVIDTIGGVVTAYANAGATSDQLKGIITVLSSSFVDQATKLGVPKEKAQEYADVLKQLPPEVFTKFNPTEIDKLLTKAKEGKDKVDGLNKSEAKPKADVDDTTFNDKMSAAERRLNDFGNKHATATIDVNQTTHVNQTTTPGTTVPPNGNANGGFYLRAYKDGGEDHSAQIAPAGAMRLWAEPETGGEAYIPLGRNKRAKSMKILKKVAKEFGYKLEAYAGGGYVGSAIKSERDFGNLTGYYAATRRHSASFAAAQAAAAMGVSGNDAAAQAERIKAMHEALMQVAKTYTEVRQAAGEAAADQLAKSGLVGEAYDNAARKIIDAANQKKDADKAWAEESKRVHEQVLDDEFRRGKRSVANYLGILNSRLKATKRNSAEWLAIQEQIWQIADDEQAKREQAMQARADRGAGSFGSQTNVVDKLSGQAGVTSGQIDAFLNHAQDVGKKFNDVIKQLTKKGFDKNLIADIISKGPEALPFAQTLAGMDAKSVNGKLGKIAGLDASIANQSARIIDQSAKVTIGSVTFEIHTPGAGQLTAAQLRKIVGDGMGKIAVQIRQG